MMTKQEPQVGNEELENCSLVRELTLDLSNGDLSTNLIVFNLVVNAVLTLTATLGNGMIIVAILTSQNLQTPSYLLITSLAFTDLLMGLVFHPLQIVFNTYNLQGDVQRICRMGKVYMFIGLYLGVVSLMMATCISIDRYLALTLRHRYNIIVTKKRVRLLISIVWIATLFVAFPASMNVLNADSYSAVAMSLVLVLFSITCVFYIKSFRALHLYTVQVQAQQPNPLAGNFDVVRYRKTLKTMVVVLACLLVCITPMILTAVASMVLGSHKQTYVYDIFRVLAIIAYSSNSSLNPVIYLVRFGDIRHACRETFSMFSSFI